MRSPPAGQRLTLRNAGNLACFLLFPGNHNHGWNMVMIPPWRLIPVALVAFIEPCLAEKLVDPNAVAPEYRAAAEKRRAEQIKILECNHKADAAKVLPRDRAAHVSQCLDAASQ
jgi:hypothetical protein